MKAISTVLVGNKTFIPKKHITFPRAQNCMEKFINENFFFFLLLYLEFSWTFKHEVCLSRILLALNITMTVVHYMMIHSTHGPMNAFSIMVHLLGTQLSIRRYHHHLKYTVCLHLRASLCNRYLDSLHPCKTETLYSWTAHFPSPHLEITILLAACFLVRKTLKLKKTLRTPCKQSHAALTF